MTGGCVEESSTVSSVTYDVLVSHRRLVLGAAQECIRCDCGGRPRGQLTDQLVSHDSRLRRVGTTHKGDEEENDVHDAEGKGGLEHGATLVHVYCQSVFVRDAKVSEWSQIQEDIVGASSEICTAGIGDSS